MKRLWMFLPLVALLTLIVPLDARTAPAELDPNFQRILEQEQIIINNPTDQEARQKLLDYSLSEEGKALTIVGWGVKEKGRNPKQALLMAQRAAQTNVLRWLAYHSIWQKDISVNFGTVEAEVTGTGTLLFQGETPDGKIIVVQRFPYPPKVTVKIKPTPAPTPAPTVAPTPLASPSAAPTGGPSVAPAASATPETSPTPAPTPSQTAAPTEVPSVAPAASVAPVTSSTPAPTATAAPTAVPSVAPVASPSPPASPAPTPKPVPTFHHVN